MAEENPHIEIKIPPKPINNAREQYLYENEKLILGRHGFILKGYPTKKEKLHNNINKKDDFVNNNNNSCKLQRNFSLGKLVSKNIIDYKNKKKININNKSQIFTSKTNSDVLSQPILRFKNRTDLERICDIILPYVPPNEQESLQEIRSRHVHSIDFPKGKIYNGALQNFKNFNHNLNSSNSAINLRYQKYNSMDENKEYDNDNNNNIKPKIYFTRLQRLNADARKIRSNLHFKTHFKGVESVFINPKQIYDIIKKDEGVSQRKIGHYAYNDKLEKEKIEKRNEYKKDINDLLLEEKEKQNFINTKEFSNYLNNKEYFNDRVLNNKEESKEEKMKKIEDLNYLKNLAFKDNQKKSGNISYNESGEINTDNSTNEGTKKIIKNNFNFENEHQLRIGSKVYHMQNQMDQIAREILNKCKFYSIKKE